MQPDVSLVIAVFNGESDIGTTLLRIQQYFDKQPYPSEVIVVDDGSRDATAPILTTAALAYPQMNILTNYSNQGKGYSVRRGVLESRGRYVFYTDADLAYPIEQIEKFLEPLRAGSHELVVGSRVLPDSHFELHPRYFRYLYRRHLMSRTFNWLVRTSLGLHVTDTQCAIKGFQAGAGKRIFDQVRISGFAFDVEVLTIAHLLGYRIMELPVTYAYGGEISSVTLIRSGVQALNALGKIYARRRRGGYAVPTQVFLQRQ